MLFGKDKTEYDINGSKGEILEQVSVSKISLPFCVYEKHVSKNKTDQKKSVEVSLTPKGVYEMIGDGILLSFGVGLFGGCCKGIATIIDAVKNKKE